MSTTPRKERLQAAAHAASRVMHNSPALRQIFDACRAIGGKATKVEMNTGARGVAFVITWSKGGESYTANRLITDHDLPEGVDMADAVCEALRDAMALAVEQRALPGLEGPTTPTT